MGMSPHLLLLQVDSTRMDYIHLKANHRNLVKDNKVVHGEEVFKQHKLVVCDLGFFLGQEEILNHKAPSMEA